MQFFFNFAALALAVSQALAGPIIGRQTYDPRDANGDPVLLTPEATLAKGLVCVGKSLDEVRNPVLLMPGTCTMGNQSYGAGYAKILPMFGYDPCYITTPRFMLEDGQANVEYLVYGVRELSKRSTNGKTKLLTWSLGGTLAQWGFTFFPTLKDQVSTFIAWAPDFRGTLFASVQNFPFIGEPSLFQQVPGSHFLTALKTHGGLNAYVPTTVIYSTDDDVVQPEMGADASSPPSSGPVTNFEVRSYCGSNFKLGHFDELDNEFVYQILKAALQSPTVKADSGDVNSSQCSEKCASVLTQVGCDANANAYQFGLNYFIGEHTPGEPALRSYVTSS